MMPLKHLLKNKLLLQKHFHVQEISMDDWPFWMFEENVKLVNEIIEEEDKQRKKEEEKQQQNTPNFNPSSITKNMPNMGNLPKY
jgi:glucan phosphorylase